MTPKEKAEELFDKFMKPIDELHKYPMCFSTAKQCALIAVDELIKETGSKFWYDVKHELENL
jgi:hypothetical protein